MPTQLRIHLFCITFALAGIGFFGRAEAGALFDLNDLATPKTEIAKKLQSQTDSWTQEVQILRLAAPTNANLQKIENIKATIDLTKAAQSLVNGTPPTHGGIPVSPEALQRIKEIVRWAARPVWVVCKGVPWFPSDAPADYASLVAPHIDSFSKIADATGLVSLWDVSQTGTTKFIQVVGTGIVVGAHRILTNKHVVTDGGFGYEDTLTGQLKLYPNRRARVDFPLEYANCASGHRQTKTVDVIGVEPIQTNLDVAVLITTSSLPAPVQFPESSGVVTGDRIAVIGYPSRPGDSDTFLTPIQIDKIFSAPDSHTPFPAERFAAGSTIYDPGVDDGYFGYDATTWEGNSGSVVVSLADGSIIGLHSQGLQAKTEGAGYNEGVLTKYVASLLKALPSDATN
jgi:V8-like Glu-specific endopeptidase